MCCTDEEKARYNHDMLELMPSHIAPSFAYNERAKDHYAAYNKPGCVQGERHSADDATDCWV